ncbi:MAG: HisA/HisF-related TIM barrel protein, partial [Planctomycetota bacterium]
MLVYPAIDIAKGKCVRLIQGRADEETVYYEDPLQAARHWQGAGARALHVVDLDGALSRGSALTGPSGEEEAGPILSIQKQAAALPSAPEPPLPGRCGGVLSAADALSDCPGRVYL